MNEKKKRNEWRRRVSGYVIKSNSESHLFELLSHPHLQRVAEVGWKGHRKYGWWKISLGMRRKVYIGEGKKK